MKSDCKILSRGEWHEAKWFGRVRRCAGVRHRVKFVVQVPSGETILIPACGFYVTRSQIKGLKPTPNQKGE